MATIDKNGLLLSNQSDSGYKFVTTLFEGPLAGLFIAFADVLGDERQYLNSQHGKRVDGFLGYKNVVALGVYEDVRDAAYVGQAFYGEDSASRNANIDALFEGNESVIPMPHGNWQHDPDYASIEKAKGRASKRVNIDIQQGLHNFHKANAADYNVKSNDAREIRAAMKAHIDAIETPKNSDVEEAARLAFEPYKK